MENIVTDTEYELTPITLNALFERAVSEYNIPANDVEMLRGVAMPPTVVLLRESTNHTVVAWTIVGNVRAANLREFFRVYHPEYRRTINGNASVELLRVYPKS